MNSGIKPRNKRMPAFYRSVSASQAEDASKLPPSTPYPGLVNIPEQIGFNIVEEVKAVMLEMQREREATKQVMDKLEHVLTKQVHVMDKLTHALSEVQTVKDILENSKPEIFHRVVRGEKSDSASFTKEPQGLMKDSIEEEQLYQDVCKLSVGKIQIGSIENQLYGLAESNSDTLKHRKRNDLDRKETKKHQDELNNTTTGITKPKVRSTSLQTRIKTVAVQPRTRSAIHIHKEFDERECLANALQFHIEVLVDGLIFHDSELPDCLLAEGCLTEDECSTVGKLHDRKDQIRVLLSLIKGRDLRVLKGFMKHIKLQNPDVAQKIIEKFESNKHDGVRGNLCALCKLEKQFNVKHVGDGLWSVQAIDDGLYNNIIYSEAPVGAQSKLWKEVFLSLKRLDPQKGEIAQNKLIHALSSKNLFIHLADGVKDLLIKNHGKLTCACEPRFVLPKRRPSFEGITSAESCPPDSSSDGTSNDLVSSDGTENENIQDRENIDGMSKITEVHEIPQSPPRIFSTNFVSEHQQGDNISEMAPENSFCASQENVHSGYLNDCPGQAKSLTIPEKPIPAIKPPVPAIKPLVPSKSKTTNNSTQTKQKTSFIKTSAVSTLNQMNMTHSGQLTENVIGAEADDIPPFPEKKNKEATQYFV